MQIRYSESIDCKALEHIMKSTFYLACPDDSDRELQDVYIAENFTAEHFNTLLHDSAYKIWVAVYSGKVVGLAVLDIESNELAVLSKIYVLSEYHGKGIAKSLYQTLLNYAQSKQFKTIKLYVYSQNHRAKRFYEAQGFVFIDEDEFKMMSETHLDHIYELALS